MSVITLNWFHFRTESDRPSISYTQPPSSSMARYKRWYFVTADGWFSIDVFFFFTVSSIYHELLQSIRATFMCISLNWHPYQSIMENFRGNFAFLICTETLEFSCAIIDHTWFKIHKQISVFGLNWSSYCVHLSLSENGILVQCALVLFMFAHRMTRIDLVSVGYKMAYNIKPMRLFVCDCVNVQIKFTCRCWQELRMTTWVSLHLAQAQSQTGHLSHLYRLLLPVIFGAAATTAISVGYLTRAHCIVTTSDSLESFVAQMKFSALHTQCLPFKLAFWDGIERWCAVDCAFVLLFTLSIHLLVLEYLKMLQFFLLLPLWFRTNIESSFTYLCWINKSKSIFLRIFTMCIWSVHFAAGYKKMELN